MSRSRWHFRFTFSLALICVLCSSASWAQDRFTLEQILSSPFPSNLVAAPHHGKLAWVQNAEGIRNLWTAVAPHYKARQITRFDEDDGQELASLQFGPGANHVVFVRGGAPNRRGEIPNPTSEPDGAERAVWIVEADDGSHLRRLAEGSSPAISPDGKTVAFLRNGQIWTVPSVDEGEPSQLATIRGSASSLRWSPTGASIAFVSRRGDHSFIGIYSMDATLQYIDPSLGHDQEPVFSPDGNAIAYLRNLNERTQLPFAPRRTSTGWSIRVTDLSSGQSRNVWSAHEGRGSAFRGVVAHNQLLWTKENEIVFPWEKDGWTHLYAVPSAGGEARLLTPGAFEVEDVHLASDGGTILFSSNQGDIDRRHIWRVSVGDEAPQPVSSGEGIEWSPVLTGDGSAIAYLASDAIRPAHPIIVPQSEGGEPRALTPESHPSDFPGNLVLPEAVTFTAADGLQIPAQLFKPSPSTDGADGRRHPAVIFFHGGSRRQMLLGWHYRGYYHNAYALNQFLASRGYVVLSVNYRSGIGYGLEFREALDYGARGASEFQDVIGAGLYLKARDDVDGKRIALWGGSYGGYLTALGLARASDLFAAGVDLHGVHDWNVVIQNFVPSYDPLADPELARLAFESSPMASIDTWRSPVLLIHGDDDRNVPFRESVDLAEALALRGVPFEQLVFPDEVHGFLLHSNWLKAFHAAYDFLENTLRAKNP